MRSSANAVSERIDPTHAPGRRRRLGTFLVALVAAAAVVVAFARVAGIDLVSIAPLYMFTPAIATLVVVLVHDVALDRIGFVRRLNRWSAVAWLAPVAFAVVVLAVSIAVPGARYEPAPDAIVGVLPTGLPGILTLLGLSLVVGVTINAVFGFGEELGWRGYLLTELRYLGFWRASLVIGVLWGLWHAPIIAAGYNYPTNPTLGIGTMTLLSVLLSPPFTYVTLRAHSVIAPSVMHGTFNSAIDVTILFAAGYSRFVVGVTGLAGIAVLVVVNIGIYLIEAPSLESLWDGLETTEVA